jgi:hypothetical protein
MTPHIADSGTKSQMVPSGATQSFSPQLAPYKKTNKTDLSLLLFNPKPTVEAYSPLNEMEAGGFIDHNIMIPEQNFLHRKIGEYDHIQHQVEKTASPPFIQRLPSTPQVNSSPRTTLAPGIGPVRYRPSGAITRQEFDNYVRIHFGVNDVHTGTQTEQEQRIVRRGNPAPTIPGWQSWDPGSASEDYTSIIDGMEEMVSALGALPQVNQIIFFKNAYEPDPTTGVGILQPNVGASFGAGEMVIYESFEGSTMPAAGISTPQGTTFRSSSRSSNISYTIIHELGHGVAEAGSNNSRQMFDHYRAEVGWIGSPPVLYDIGQPTVRAAIANSTALPVQHIITADRWRDPSVSEQPMSRYAVEGGPAEDFAETVAAYVTNASALQQRSPKRYQFLQTHMASWISRMRAMMPGIVKPPVGDFPLPSGNTMMA